MEVERAGGVFRSADPWANLYAAFFICITLSTTGEIRCSILSWYGCRGMVVFLPPSSSPSSDRGSSHLLLSPQQWLAALHSSLVFDFSDGRLCVFWFLTFSLSQHVTHTISLKVESGRLSPFRLFRKLRFRRALRTLGHCCRGWDLSVSSRGTAAWRIFCQCDRHIRIVCSKTPLQVQKKK
eukprot:RCo039235